MFSCRNTFTFILFITFFKSIILFTGMLYFFTVV